MASIREYFKLSKEFCIPARPVLDKGFTILETLIVVLIIGILCATGISVYSRATYDSQLRTISDRIQTFFSACKHRAKLRNVPVRIEFENGNISADNSSLLKLRIPELTQKKNQYINGLTFLSSQTLNLEGQRLKNLILFLELPGEKVATISIKL